jgi:hypothetical protein
MQNRIGNRISQFVERRDQCDEAQPIGAILKELLARYEAKFPEIRVTIVETASMAAY